MSASNSLDARNKFKGPCETQCDCVGKWRLPGTTQAKIVVNQKNYQVAFIVAKHLVADVILRLDVLRQHHSVNLELDSDQPETDIYAGVNVLAFLAMKISPPTMLFSSVYGANRIAAKSRHHKPQDVAFMESEGYRTLAESDVSTTTESKAIVFQDEP